jgi:hypothetical protein
MIDYPQSINFDAPCSTPVKALNPKKGPVAYIQDAQASAEPNTTSYKNGFPVELTRF